MCILHEVNSTYLCCFCLLALNNNTAINIVIYLFEYLFSVWGDVLRNRIIGLYGNYMFKYLRNHQTVFHNFSDGCWVERGLLLVCIHKVAEMGLASCSFQ